MFVFGLSVIFLKDIFVLLLGEEYRIAIYILPFLIFNPIMYTISETTVIGLIFKKKSKLQVISATGACFTNILGNYILVPKLGCVGAAISTGISYIIFFALRTSLSNRHYYINYKLIRFYCLTFVTSLYALYSTFFKFSIFSVFGYFACLLVLVMLYRDTLVVILKYVGDYLKKLGLKSSNN